MSHLDRRVARLETALVHSDSRATHPPFSFDVIEAVLEGRAPKGWTEQEWQAVQVKAEGVFNYAAIDGTLGPRGEYEK